MIWARHPPPAFRTYLLKPRQRAVPSFVISGPGFSAGAGGAITVNVNTSNVADPASLVTAINAGIQAAATAGSAQAKAFGDANITAEIHTGTDGAQQLEFVSSDTAFQVSAGDTTANALMGNFVGQSNARNWGQAHGITTPLSTAGLLAVVLKARSSPAERSRPPARSSPTWRTAVHPRFQRIRH